MAIKADLSADRERGAGYGQFRISGFGESAGPVDFSLMRNQGTQPYLGKGGMWQASETWHTADAMDIDGDNVVIPVGPDIVDAIVGQSANVAYRLTVAAGAKIQRATLSVHRPLLGSGAAAADETVMLERQQQEDAARRAREEEERRAREEEDAMRRAAEEDATRQVAPAAEEETQVRGEDSAPDSEHIQQDPQEHVAKRRRWPVVAALLGGLALLGGAGAWFGCLIPGFGPPACTAEPSADIALAEPPGEPESSCVGLTDGNACLAMAQKALEQKRLEPARQMFQQAAELGSVEANIFVARMYDPETWSADASPVAAANWETAVYWYERAARQGDDTGQFHAGKLLCQNASTEFEKAQGRSYLDRTAKAGSAEARTLLAECQ